MICASACTKAAILCALNAYELPPRGTVIYVPSYVVERYTVVQQLKITACALRFGIYLRKN